MRTQLAPPDDLDEWDSDNWVEEDDEVELEDDDEDDEDD